MAARLILVGAIAGGSLIIAVVAWLWPKDPVPPPPIIIRVENE